MGHGRRHSGGQRLIPGGDMKERTITVKPGDVPVTAYCRDGLAVYRVPRTDRWTITHIRSGLSLGMYLKTKREAVRAMKRLLQLDVEWYKDEWGVMTDLEAVAKPYDLSPKEYTHGVILSETDDLLRLPGPTPIE